MDNITELVRQKSKAEVVLDSLKQTAADIEKTVNERKLEPQTAVDIVGHLDHLRKKQEIDAIMSKLQQKEEELRLKEEQLQTRNQHILDKAKARNVDLSQVRDEPQNRDIELTQQQNREEDIKIAPAIELKEQTAVLLNNAKTFIGDAAITVDNITSVTSNLMQSAADFSDLSGRQKRNVVLGALGELAVNAASSKKDAELNTQFVLRGAGSLIDALYNASERQVQYKKQSPGQLSSEQQSQSQSQVQTSNKKQGETSVVCCC